ncbi:DctP family TRAP transporter solute-binding subunit [Martelella sp. AD-3]|uniref:DctP family TRAP transporter solute-binding subunit n=1 Tax=Martelella sp. AD-3 TaxID=686597 RepID=UPI000463188A|nr:DctP family TRAP transporter solute-binding subunit [Martelella sp. AD-3]AMM87045.1 C4-dicarboxylate ABC transporter substrate-binding protein [Martelella sp. AD-3]
MKRFTTGLLAIGMLVAGTVSANATTLRLAHAAPQGDLQQKLAERFADDVKTMSDGKITVQIFPQGQLGNDSQMITGARSGIIDIVMSGLNNFTGMMPELGGLMLPFMITDRDQAYEVYDGPIGQEAAAEFENFDLKVLGFPENGFREITNNRGPIVEPKDLEGLRMRTNNSEALNDMFALLKANPQQIPVAELYTALETGVVDAQDHPITIVQSFKFYEVQKYLSLTNHSYAALVLAMNGKKFASLPEDQQEIIMKAAKVAVDYERQLSKDSEASMIADLEKEGMVVNSDVDRQAFQEAVKPVWKTFTDKYGDTLVNKVQAVTTK